LEGAAAQIDLEELRHAMNRVAAAALIGRYWPDGNRHDASLALAGGLLLAGWSVDDVVALVQAICAAASDHEVFDRERCVRDTAATLESGAKATGWPSLAKLLGNRGDTIVTTVRGWLGIRATVTTPSNPERNGTTHFDHQRDTDNPISLTVNPAACKPGRFTVVAINGVGQLHLDTIDLKSAASRKRFVRDTLRAAFKGTPEDWPEDVREHLERQLLAFASVTPKPAEPSATPSHHPVIEDPRIAELARMQNDIRTEAEALLGDPKLAELVGRDIEKCGVAGEKKLVMTEYLIGVSAQLPEPLSAIIKGQSSAGKSYTIRRVGEMFPPEVVLWANSITTNALYYMPPGSLMHRYVIGGERSRAQDDDTAERTRALRDLMSDGVLDKWVTLNVEGELKSVHLHQKGPIAFVQTTTLNEIFAEDENRCLQLRADESEQQTRKILDASARAAAGVPSFDATRVREVHHAIQRMIPRVDVVIPFAPALSEAFSCLRVEARREFPHLLRLVKASALLHFRQRDRDTNGNVIAERGDYSLASKLADAPLRFAHGGLSDAAWRFFDRLRARSTALTFTTDEAREGETVKKRTVYSWMEELLEARLIEQTEPHRGKVPARWQLTGRDPDEITRVVPRVSEVFPLVGHRTRAHMTQVDDL
jgi:hypothetical protein